AGPGQLERRPRRRVDAEAERVDVHLVGPHEVRRAGVDALVGTLDRDAGDRRGGQDVDPGRPAGDVSADDLGVRAGGPDRVRRDVARHEVRDHDTGGARGRHDTVAAALDGDPGQADADRAAFDPDGGARVLD